MIIAHAWIAEWFPAALFGEYYFRPRRMGLQLNSEHSTAGKDIELARHLQVERPLQSHSQSRHAVLSRHCRCRPRCSRRHRCWRVAHRALR